MTKYGRLPTPVIGDVFDRWTVVNPVVKLPSNPIRYCLVRCTCGQERTVRLKALYAGTSRSCGCLHSEIVRITHHKHGDHSSRLYHIWSDMLTRCLNKNYKRFHDYGGRGITVCQEWRDYINFRDWSNTHGYADNLTIDRVDTNGDYTPDNCRFVTKTQQSLNKRSSVLLTCFGETKTAKEWVHDPRCVCSYTTLLMRYHNNWPHIDCITKLPHT